MKRITFFLLAFILFCIHPKYTFAQEYDVVISEPTTLEEETSSEEILDPISVESPFYFLTTLSENIQLLFTFDEDKKIEKALTFAERKLNGMENLDENVNPKLVEKLQARFEKLIQNVERKAEKNEQMEEARVQRVEQIRERHLNVLNDVLERVPQGQAQESIQKVIDKTIERNNARDARVKTNNKGGIVKTEDPVEEIAVED